MQKLTRLALVWLLVLPFAAVAGDSALKGQIERWEERFNAGDAAGVAALYTEDAQLFPPGSDIVEGSADIEAFWQTAIDSVSGGNSLETLEIHEAGDMGNYLVIWKKTDDGWLIKRDIWNKSTAEE